MKSTAKFIHKINQEHKTFNLNRFIKKSSVKRSQMNKYKSFNLKNIKIAKDSIEELYHGTNLSNAQDILINGIKMGKDINSISSDKEAVYLTKDLSTALNYAVWEDRTGDDKRFIILDIFIPAKKTNKLSYDGMDRYQTSWYEESDYYNENEIEDFERELKDIFQKIWNQFKPGTEMNYRFEHIMMEPFSVDGDLENIVRGKNLFKEIFFSIFNKIGLKKTRENKEKIKTVLFDYIGQYFGDYVFVSEDGSLVITKEYWGDREQIAYLENIKPSMIKGAYVNGEVFSNIQGKRIKETPKIIPSVASHYFENANMFLTKAYDNFDQIFENENLEDLLIDFKDIFDYDQKEKDIFKNMVGKELIDQIEDMESYLETLENTEEIDINKVNIFKQTIENSYYWINESHGKEFYLPTKELLYIPLNSLEKKENFLKMILKIDKISFNLKKYKIAQTQEPIIAFHGSKTTGLTSFNENLIGTGIVGPGNMKNEQKAFWFTSSFENAMFYTDPVEIEGGEFYIPEDNYQVYGNGPYYSLLYDNNDNDINLPGSETEKESEQLAIDMISKNNEMFEKNQKGMLLEQNHEDLVYKVALNIKNPYVLDGNIYPHNNMGHIIEFAKKNNYDGVIIKDYVDGAIMSNIYAVFNPNQITILPK